MLDFQFELSQIIVRARISIIIYTSGADPVNFSRGVQPYVRKNPLHTHMNTSYLIVIL